MSCRNLLVILPFLLLVSCEKKSDPITVDVVAVVNGTPITKREMVRRIELTAVPGIHKHKDRNKRALDMLINELTLSQLAKEHGLEDSPDYKKSIKFIEQQSMIRELFFEKIRANAAPDSQIIDLTLRKSLIRMTVKTLVTEEKSIADKWIKFIKSGGMFNDLIKESESDSRIRIGGSSFHWGDGTVPFQVEDGAYQTAAGEMSDILNLPNGFAILYVENVAQDVILTPYALSTKQSQIKEVLQARRESVLADEYVAKLMNSITVKQKGDGLEAVIKFIQKRLELTKDNESPLSNIMNQELTLSDDADLSLPVIKTPDFVWNGHDVTVLLRNYNYPIDKSSRGSLRKTMTEFLKSAVTDHYLALRAENIGLQSAERVKDDVKTWGTYFLSLKGLSTFAREDSTLDKEGVKSRVKALRETAQIEIKHNILEGIELTGIPMIVVWNNRFNQHLATPPLMKY